MSATAVALPRTFRLSGRPTWQALVAAGTVYGTFKAQRWINEHLMPTMTPADVVALAQGGTPAQVPMTVEWMRQWADVYGLDTVVTPIPRPHFAGPSCYIDVERLIPLWRTGADQEWLALIVHTDTDEEFLSGTLLDSPENREALTGLAALRGTG